MFTLLLLLAFLAMLSAGVPVDEVQCPRIHCPVLMCEAPESTYFQFEGQTCQGCSLCPAEVQCPLTRCPAILCDAPEPTYFHYEGQTCQGCHLCPPIDEEPMQCPRLHCPVITCEAPEPNYYRYQGETCQECSVCPATDQKRQLLTLCPQIKCLDPYPCSVPLQQTTIYVGDVTCRGCPFCPDELEKRQAVRAP